MAAWDRARRTGEQNNGPHEASPIGAIHLLRAGGQTSATPPGQRQDHTRIRPAGDLSARVSVSGECVCVWHAHHLSATITC